MVDTNADAVLDYITMLSAFFNRFRSWVRGTSEQDALGREIAEPSHGVASINPPIAIPIARIAQRLEQLQAAILRDQIPVDLALLFAMRALHNHILRTGQETNFAMDRQQGIDDVPELWKDSKVH